LREEGFLSVNEQQIHYWNEIAGPRWVEAESQLERLEEPFLRAVLAAAAAQEGERVLDVGCGAGRSTERLARAVGPGGRVVGLDLSRPLLGLARERIERSGLRHAELIQADAQVTPLPGPFDLVFSIFGVMFFADPVAAFSSFHKALDSGGRLVFLCWQPLERNPWVTVPLRAAAPFLELPRPEPGAPGPFALADNARVRTILERAGFSQVEIEGCEADLPIASSLEEGVAFIQKVGPLASPLAEAAEPRRVEALAAIRAAIAEACGEGPVRLRGATWLVRAH
jgi:SAM-dependent methyltransferase